MMQGTMSSNRPYPVRKKIRLDRPLYAEPGKIVSVTLATRNRRPVFTNGSCIRDCLKVLDKTTSNHGFSVLAYCFMPDHVHLLLENRHGADLIAFMRQFKSWSTRIVWKHGWHGQVWQRSYYDHVLREGEDIAGYVRYILGNPVRHGLVETWIEYHGAGSLVYDFSDPADWP
jgi:putative transposase